MTIGRWTCLSVLAAWLGGAQPIQAATIYVADGDDLQQALNAAQPGDVILLAQGAEFVGNFVLPQKLGDGWITIRTSTPDAVLPPPGVRIVPAYAPLLARLRSPTLDTPVLRTGPRAHHWDIRYVEFAANPLGSGDIIQLGDGSAAQNTLDLVPHHLVLRHVYVHGDPDLGQKRCIGLNAADVIIADSYVSDCKSTTQDSQAIAGWNGPGPFLIENNYLEAAGENVLFGGADPAIPDLVPSNIVFRRNLVSRPMSWRNPIIPTPEGVNAAVQRRRFAGARHLCVSSRRPAPRRQEHDGPVHRVHRSGCHGERSRQRGAGAVGAGARRNRIPSLWPHIGHADDLLERDRDRIRRHRRCRDLRRGVEQPGTDWIVKNLFELKAASHVLIEDNIFENHWKDDQPGWAFVLTPRNSGGACSWCVVEHVQFRYNLVRNVSAGLNMIGFDSPSVVTQQTNNIEIDHNLFLMTTSLGGNGWFLQMGDGPRDVRVRHNTIDSNGTTVVYAYGGSCSVPRAIFGFEYIGNAARYQTYGVNSPCGTGNPTLAAYFPGAVFLYNYIAGASATRYPAGTIERDAVRGTVRRRVRRQLRRASRAAR